MQRTWIQEVYEMIDQIPFSRPIKNIHRQFSDGLMMAQLISHFNPKLVDLHNYPHSNSLIKKIENWSLLNSKVLKKLNIFLSKTHIQDIANSVPGVIEEVLYEFVIKFERPSDQATLGDTGKKSQITKKKGENIDQKKSDLQQKEDGKESKEDDSASHSVQAEQILNLVSKIDQANDELQSLIDLSRTKDEIIKNLQLKLEKILFG